MVKYVVNLYFKWDDFDFDFAKFDTEDEAKALIEYLEKVKYLDIVYPSEDVDVSIKEMNVDGDNLTETITRINEEIEEEKARIAAAEEEKLKMDVVALKELREVRDLFAPFDMQKALESWDAFKQIVNDLHKAVVESGKEINLFDGKIDYHYDGTTKIWNGSERVTYYPIRVFVEVDENCKMFFYQIGGKYDIDEDIARIEKKLNGK